MLLPDNIHPEDSVYYNGAVLLQVVQKEKSWDLLDLYSEVKKYQKMTMPIFILSLGWLYMLESVEMSENGRIAVCI